MKITRQAFIYFGSYLLSGVISFITVALFTRQLSPQDYGIINLYSSFVIFLMPFISGGILHPLTAEYFKRDHQSFSYYFTNAQIIPTLALLLLSLVCFIAAYPLAKFLRVTPIWIYVVPLTGWLIFINETSATIARVKNMPWLFAGFSIGKSLVEMSLSVVLVFGLLLGWQGRLSSALLSALILLCFSAYFILKWGLLKGPIHWKFVKSIFMSSIPFILERLSIFFLGYSDKYFIDNYVVSGTAEVGLYSLAGQIASIIFLVILSLNSAYYPHLFKNLSSKTYNTFHNSTIWYISIIVAVLALLIIFMPLLFSALIDEKYYSALPYANVLAVGYLMWGIYNAFLGYLIYQKNNKQILSISGLGIVISLVMNMILVKIFGVWGAAFTSVFTYSLMAFLCFSSAKRYLKSNKY